MLTSQFDSTSGIKLRIFDGQTVISACHVTKRRRSGFDSPSESSLLSSCPRVYLRHFIFVLHSTEVAVKSLETSLLKAVKVKGYFKKNSYIVSLFLFYIIFIFKSLLYLLNSLIFIIILLIL